MKHAIALILACGRKILWSRRTLERASETVRNIDWPDNLVLAGTVPKREIPRLTRTADVLMTLFKDVPILSTNSPNKFFDYLAAGLPIVVDFPGKQTWWFENPGQASGGRESADDPLFGPIWKKVEVKFAGTPPLS